MPAMSNPSVLLIRIGCDDGLLPDAVAALAAAAGVAPESVVRIDRLAAAVLDAPAGLRSALSAGRLVIGCRRPRAVRVLLDRAGLLPQVPAEWVALPGREEPARPFAGGEPWYPAIDRERCTRCGQCRSYCLFGVYAQDSAGNVTVCHPLNCKAGCPACARICPAVAIVFPFCPESPIDGDPVTPEAVARNRVAVKLDERLGRNARQTLANRRRVLDLRRAAPPAGDGPTGAGGR
jgi:ferredoxin